MFFHLNFSRKLPQPRLLTAFPQQHMTRLATSTAINTGGMQLHGIAIAVALLGALVLSVWLWAWPVRGAPVRQVL